MYVGIKVLSNWALVGQSINSNSEKKKIDWRTACAGAAYQQSAVWVLWFIYCWWCPVGFERSWKSPSGKQIMFYLSVQSWSTRLFGFIGPESLWRSTNDLDWCRSSGKDGVDGSAGSVRYWKTASLSCRLIPPSHLHNWPLINSLSCATSSHSIQSEVRQLPLGGLLCCQHC